MRSGINIFQNNLVIETKTVDIKIVEKVIIKIYTGEINIVIRVIIQVYWSLWSLTGFHK